MLMGRHFMFSPRGDVRAVVNVVIRRVDQTCARHSTRLHTLGTQRMRSGRPNGGPTDVGVVMLNIWAISCWVAVPLTRDRDMAWTPDSHRH